MDITELTHFELVLDRLLQSKRRKKFRKLLFYVFHLGFQLGRNGIVRINEDELYNNR